MRIAAAPPGGGAPAVIGSRPDAPAGAAGADASCARFSFL